MEAVRHALTANIGLCASGAEGINISICAAIISGAGGRKSISKRTNNQLFHLHSADGSGRRNMNSPPAQSPIVSGNPQVTFHEKRDISFRLFIYVHNRLFTEH
jgi:hypothetical protein